MKSPFPGMDPYLERYWGDVHHRLIQYTCDTLQPGLPPDLQARVEERVFLETDSGAARAVVPDVHVARLQKVENRPMELRDGAGTAVAQPEAVFDVLEELITEGYLEIRERQGGKVITVIEFLSPANKMGGVGQQKYLEKQQQVLHSDASLMEIDLVRAGQRVLAMPQAQLREAGGSQYLACISPGWRRTRRELYVMPMRERLKVLPIPLRQTEAVLPLNLQALLDQAYTAGRYENTDYTGELEPPLVREEAEWAAGLLSGKSVRGRK